MLPLPCGVSDQNPVQGFYSRFLVELWTGIGDAQRGGSSFYAPCHGLGMPDNSLPLHPSTQRTCNNLEAFLRSVLVQTLHSLDGVDL